MESDEYREWRVRTASAKQRGRAERRAKGRESEKSREQQILSHRLVVLLLLRVGSSLLRPLLMLL